MMLADLVIIDAPPAESAEGQVACSVADRSLLVIEEGKTKVKDAATAVSALGRTALGVVLVRHPKQMVDPGFLSEGNWNPVPLPAAGGGFAHDSGAGVSAAAVAGSNGAPRHSRSPLRER
jgi:hypothetical protein